jgi:MFS family permease
VQSGNEIGPFRAIEESTLAHLTPTANRGDIYAWYSLIGTAGTALGMASSGWSITYMNHTKGWDIIKTYRTLFYGYAILGILKLCLALSLGKVIEVEKEPLTPIQNPETAPLLGSGAEDVLPKKNFIRSKLPAISKESRVIVVNLCILFALDSFASGLVPL